ncbi:MAG: methyltransferase, partial [Thermoplasmatota archaeon]
MSEYYPWPGKYYTGNPESNIAIVTLDKDFSFDESDIALWGPMKTENLGIERVVVNTISNPNIRYLIVCGKEIRGHKSGRSLICFYKNGVDEDGRIIEAPGAVPYIENISEEAISRFRNQVKIYDLIGVV